MTLVVEDRAASDTAGPAPLVSILLPAYQAAATLGAALRSVARQTERRFECVVVDDGSSDATARIAGEVVRRDPRFRLVRRPHSGLVETLLAGLSLCRAPLVARMDADDLMHRDRLAAQSALLDARPDLAAVGSHVRIFPRDHLQAGFRAYERWLNAIAAEEDVEREAFVECPVAHPTLMVRREVLERHGYRRVGWPEDYDLVLRMLAAGDRIGVVPRRLLAWRDHPGRFTRRAPECGIERFVDCKAEFLASGFLRAGPGYVLWGYGSTGRLLRRALARHGKAPTHVVEVHPGRLGNRIHGARVIAPGELPALERRPIVASVAGAVPRAQIRHALVAMSFVERRDFVVAA